MDKTSVSISVIVGFTIMAVTGLITYGCMNSNQQYYDMARSCTEAGGSFIPTTGNNGAAAICLNPVTQSPAPTK